MGSRPTPGVYEDLTPPNADKPIRDDIVGIVGLTRRGPVDRPVLIESWEAFVSSFGPRSDVIATPDAVLGFFVNGGRAAHVVRVLDRDKATCAKAVCQALQLADPSLITPPRVPESVAVAAAPAPPRAGIKIPLRVPIRLGYRFEPILPLALPLRLPSRPAAAVPPSPAPEEAPSLPRLIWYAAQGGDEDPGSWANGTRCSLRFNLQQLTPSPTQSPGAEDQLRIPLDIRNKDAWGRIDRGSLLWVPQPGHPDRERFAAVVALRRIVSARVADGSATPPLLVLDLDRPLPITVEDRVFIVEATLDVQSSAGRERHEALGLCPEHPRYLPAVLRSSSRIVGLATPDPSPILYPLAQGLSAVQGAPMPPPGVALDILGRDLLSEQGLSYVGNDGIASVTREHFFGKDYDEEAPEEARGLSCLYPISDVSLIMVPDLVLPANQLEEPPLSLPPAPPSCKRPVWVCGTVDEPALVNEVPELEQPTNLVDRLHLGAPMDELIAAQLRVVRECERLGDRIALLCPPPSANPRQAILWRSRFDSALAVAYYPWLRFGDAVTHPPVRLVPPVGVAAGIIARSEIQFGVGRAPANLNAVFCSGLSQTVDDAEWARLHEVSCSVFRQLPNGVRLMGARTLSSDSEYRYLHVRRLITHIKRLLQARMQWVVFENNNPGLWARLRRDIEARVLRPLFVRGAFATDQPQTSYFIRCDEVLNSRQSRDVGRLICDVGVAPALPSEYIVFRLSATRNEGLSIGEVG